MARKEIKILLPDTEPVESFVKAVATGAKTMANEIKARNEVVKKEKLRAKIARLQGKLGE